MINIYFKENRESYESVFDMLSHYFSFIADGFRHPTTYWADTHEMQCPRNKNRSFDDLLLMAQHYFPGATIKDVVKALVRYNAEAKRENLIACIRCSTINRYVISNCRYYKELLDGANYVCSLLPPLGGPSDQPTANSQWTLAELHEMAKDD